MPNSTQGASPKSPTPNDQSDEKTVDRVARAIHDACAEIEKPYPTAIPCFSMNKNKEGWRIMARAAIASMPPAREAVTPKEDKFIISEMFMAYVDGKTGMTHTNYGCGESDENAMRNILALLISKGWKQS